MKHSVINKYLRRLSLLYALLLLNAGWLQAQNPTPAARQSEPILLTGATVHIGNGQVIENGAVAFSEGKLTYVGKADQLPAEVSNYPKTDVSGKHVYPGLILMNTILGLYEVGAVTATRDENETGPFNPNVRAMIAYNADSKIIPTLRSNGVLLAQVTPTGGAVSGQSSVMQLDAWNWEDAVVKGDDGIHMNWPNKYLRPRWWMGETDVRVNEDYDKTVDYIRKALADGKVYAGISSPEETNLKLEAMKGLYDGSKTMYLHAEDARAIVQGVQLLLENGVKKVAVVNGYEAFYVKDFLKENNIPVVIDNVHRLPEREDVDVDMPYKLPYILNNAGLEVVITYTEGMVGRARNLAFLAGTAAGYGLTKEEALQMITLNPARVMGIADKVGSLEKGKEAYVVVSEGDILDMKDHQILHAFIQGRAVNLNDVHKTLYERFTTKYERQGK